MCSPADRTMLFSTLMNWTQLRDMHEYAPRESWGRPVDDQPWLFPVRIYRSLGHGCFLLLLRSIIDVQKFSTYILSSTKIARWTIFRRMSYSQTLARRVFRLWYKVLEHPNKRHDFLTLRISYCGRIYHRSKKTLVLTTTWTWNIPGRPVDDFDYIDFFCYELSF